MTKYLAGVLTAIAMGVLAVAYGLLAPGRAVNAMSLQPASAPDMMYQSQAAPVGYTAQPAQVVTYVPVQAPSAQVPVASAPRAVQTVSYEPAPRVRASSRRVVTREPRRDWKRTALIVGGSTAAGAGVGGIFGGKKGALIGAAIAGGASTIFQTTKRD